MEKLKKGLGALTVAFFLMVAVPASMGQTTVAPTGENRMQQGMIIRIAEIEVHPPYRAEYLDYAKEVAKISVHEEPGVICLFPLQLKADGNVFRIVEIYRSEADYRQHLATPHFLRYKQGTLHMVKSLALVDSEMVYPEGLASLFRKAEQE